MGRGGRCVSERLCCDISKTMWQLMIAKYMDGLSPSQLALGIPRTPNVLTQSRIGSWVHTDDKLPDHFQTASLFGLTAKYEVSPLPEDPPSVLILDLELMTLLSR